jgi:hypothetical protein
VRGVRRQCRRMSFSRLQSGESASAILAAFFMCAVSLSSCKRADSSAPASSSPTSAAPASATAAASGTATATSAAAKPVPEAVTKLLGRWMRSDGGYVLELRKADISGTIEAGYFNPKSINVSRAAWMQGAGGLQVMVELNDVGYPGATYVLSHDAATDRLVGQYTQPAMQQSFEIDFVRQPKQ